MKTVVIVTYGRTGSTLLANLFSAIPGYHISGENNDVLWGLYRSYCAARDGYATVAKRQRRTGPSEPWYMMDRVDPEDYAAKLIDLFFSSIVQPPEGSVGRGFKEIRFLQHPAEFSGYLDFLLDHVPDCVLVFNQRDHASVAQSGWWKKMPEAKVRKRLTKYDAMMEAYVQEHPDRTFLCRYEDWTADPAALQPVFDKLGVPLDRERLQAVLDTPLTHGKKPQ